MADVIPMRRRPRPPRDTPPPDTTRILSVVPARPGWLAWTLAYDDVTIPGAQIPMTWSEPVAAWGEVEWTWGGDPPLPVEVFWEALVCGPWGTLELAAGGPCAANIVEREVTGPRQEPPTWAQGSVDAYRERFRLVAEYLASKVP